MRIPSSPLFTVVLAILLILLVGLSVVCAEDPPACQQPLAALQQQIAAMANTLSQEQLLPTGSQRGEAGQQLVVLERQLRFWSIRYRMADSDLHSYQDTAAMAAETIRQLQEQLRAVQQEKEHLVQASQKAQEPAKAEEK